jgi:integrase
MLFARLISACGSSSAQPRKGSPPQGVAAERLDLIDAIDLALGTSLRISEVLAIASHGRFLDEDEPYVDATKKVEYVRAPGMCSVPLRTHTTVRGIPLPPFAVEILREHIGRYGDGLVFRSSRGTGGPISQNNLRRLLCGIVEGTDLAWVTPHVHARRC